MTFNVIPRYFHTLQQSGVSEQQLLLENAREYVLANHTQMVESSRTMFVHHFKGEFQIQFRGSLVVRFNTALKIEQLAFECGGWREFVPRAFGEPAGNGSDRVVNEFGVAEMTMRLLEVWETLYAMDDALNMAVFSNISPRGNLLTNDIADALRSLSVTFEEKPMEANGDDRKSDVIEPSPPRTKKARVTRARKPRTRRKTDT